MFTDEKETPSPKPEFKEPMPIEQMSPPPKRVTRSTTRRRKRKNDVIVPATGKVNGPLSQFLMS